MAKRTILSVMSVIGVLAVGIGALFFLTFFKPAVAKEDETDPPRSVRTRTLEAGLQSLTIASNGFLKASRKVDIHSPLAGRVIEVPTGLKGGISVADGEMLFLLDDRKARNIFERSRSTMIRMSARYINQAGLSGNDTVAWKAFMESLGSAHANTLPYPPFGNQRQQLLASSLGVSDAWYSLESAAMNLMDHSVAAPFSGVLVGDGLAAGTWVNPGVTLATLLDISTLELKLALPVADLPFVHPGDSVSVYLKDASTLSGRVDRIEPLLSPGSQSASVYVTVIIPENDLWRPGAFVEVTIAGLEIPQAFRVSRDNLVNGKIPVYNDGHLAMLPVTILAYDGKDAILAPDFPSGTEMITTVLQNPMEGLAIRREGEE